MAPTLLICVELNTLKFNQVTTHYTDTLRGKVKTLRAAFSSILVLVLLQIRVQQAVNASLLTCRQHQLILHFTGAANSS